MQVLAIKKEVSESPIKKKVSKSPTRHNPPLDASKQKETFFIYFVDFSEANKGRLFSSRLGDFFSSNTVSSHSKI